MGDRIAFEVLALCGSLRTGSSNAALLDAIGLCAADDMAIVRSDSIGGLPLFNPDLDGDRLPEAVGAFRAAIARSDAILICSPEYARGVAGAIKNALDWLVGGPECPGKFVAVVNASQRATHADAQLRLTLQTMSARLVDAASVTVPLLGLALTAEQIAADPAFRPLVQAIAADLRQAILEDRRASAEATSPENGLAVP